MGIRETVEGTPTGTQIDAMSDGQIGEEVQRLRQAGQRLVRQAADLEMLRQARVRMAATREAIAGQAQARATFDAACKAIDEQEEVRTR